MIHNLLFVYSMHKIQQGHLTDEITFIVISNLKYFFYIIYNYLRYTYKVYKDVTVKVLNQIVYEITR